MKSALSWHCFSFSVIRYQYVKISSIYERFKGGFILTHPFLLKEFIVKIVSFSLSQRIIMVIQVKNYSEVREGIEIQNTMVSGEIWQFRHIRAR